MGKYSADRWETKFASKDCPFLQLIPLLRVPGTLFPYEDF